jgi:hypothetical protein
MVGLIEQSPSLKGICSVGQQSSTILLFREFFCLIKIVNFIKVLASWI